MPEPADRPSKPPRTWRPMALWSAGILLALGLAWLGAYIYSVLHQVNQVLVDEIVQPDDKVNLSVESVWNGRLTPYRVPDYRRAAEKLGGQEKALRALRIHLVLRRPYRAEAIALLGACGKESLPYLVRYAQSATIEDREAAMTGLWEMGPDAFDALPIIIELTRNGATPTERYRAIFTLRSAGGNSPKVISATAALLRDPDLEVIRIAAVELGMRGPSSACAVPDLTRLLAHGSPKIRYAAAMTLEMIGPQATEAIPSLVAALEDGDQDVRTAAAEALKKIRGEGR